MRDVPLGPVARKEIRRRRRLRRKEIRSLAEDLEEALGAAPFTEGDPVDRAEAPLFDVLLLGAEAVALVVEEIPVPTVRGLLRAPASRRHVTVDMGAVPYIANGADAMAPGIVEADPAIEPGQLVWIRDEKNRQPLAVGAALATGEEMVAGAEGKAVRTLHHVGDWIWELGGDQAQ